MTGLEKNWISNINMNFEDNTKVKAIGRYIGFFLGYVLFTSMLFLILRFTGRLLKGSFIHVLIITAVITLTGILLKKALK